MCRGMSLILRKKKSSEENEQKERKISEIEQKIASGLGEVKETYIYPLSYFLPSLPLFLTMMMAMMVTTKEKERMDESNS